MLMLRARGITGDMRCWGIISDIAHSFRNWLKRITAGKASMLATPMSHR